MALVKLVAKAPIDIEDIAFCPTKSSYSLLWVTMSIFCLHRGDQLLLPSNRTSWWVRLAWPLSEREAEIFSEMTKASLFLPSNRSFWWVRLARSLSKWEAEISSRKDKNFAILNESWKSVVVGGYRGEICITHHMAFAYPLGSGKIDHFRRYFYHYVSMAASRDRVNEKF